MIALRLHVKKKKRLQLHCSLREEIVNGLQFTENDCKYGEKWDGSMGSAGPFCNPVPVRLVPSLAKSSFD